MKNVIYRCGSCGQQVVFEQQSDSWVELKVIWCTRCKRNMACINSTVGTEQSVQPKIQNIQVPPSRR